MVLRKAHSVTLPSLSWGDTWHLLQKYTGWNLFFYWRWQKSVRSLSEMFWHPPKRRGATVSSALENVSPAGGPLSLSRQGECGGWGTPERVAARTQCTVSRPENSQEEEEYKGNSVLCDKFWTVNLFKKRNLIFSHRKRSCSSPVLTVCQASFHWPWSQVAYSKTFTSANQDL